MQIDDIKRRQAEQEQQRAAVDRFKQTLPAPGAAGDGMGPPQPNVDPRLSTLYGAMQAGIIGPMDYVNAMQPKEVEIKEFREIRMPDGSVQVVGFGKDGKPVKTGQTPFKPMERQNMGGFLGGIDPITGKMTNLGAMTQSPDSAASIAVQMRGQNMTDARSREATATARAEFGKPPTGYRFKQDGSLEAIPGGPADIKAGELGAKAEAKKAAQLAASDSVRNTVKEAQALVGLSTTGVGSLARVVPATDARNLSAKLETIKANLGFDRLQEMRDQSPTGGALGAVAVQELTALQSTVASLDQAQSPSQLRSALNKIDRHYGRWQRVMKGELPDSGATGSWDGGAVRKYNPATGRIE